MDLPFKLYIAPVLAAESSSTISAISSASHSTGSSSATSALKTLALGEAHVADAQFVWTTVAVAPGRYIVNGTVASGARVFFSPTSPFTVEGHDRHCMDALPEPELEASPNRSVLHPEALLATSDQTTSTGSSAGAIAGGTVAGVFAVLLLAALFIYIRKRRKHAPVALRPRSPIPPSTGEGPARMQISDTPAPTPLPFASPSGRVPSPPSPPVVDPDSAPVSPATTRNPPSAWTGGVSRPVTMYAESTVMSDDSFAEERAALRHEFGMESVGPGRRAYTSRESSVWSELPVGPDGQALALEGARRKPPRSLTFSVSNPDNTVWEDGEEHSPPPTPKR
ncbi:hypothetical protein AURDEDRAFT_112012 [Auricularia subglabra TFB-10046 SS5]|nr:hypothetical protein AURDEDRAFT_112012 [Auricularia subglabra TFB-10046 SS5]